MIKLVDLLTETQEFDFEHYKSDIKRYVSDILTNSISRSPIPIENTFYSIITGKSNTKVGNALKLGFTDKEIKKWRSIFFDSNIFRSDGIWSQIDFNPQLTRKIGLDKTLNFYITINKTKENIFNFVKAIPDLNKTLKEFSDLKQTPISWKTHAILDVFIGHNDSLKVYYYDVDFKDDIEKIVKDWANKNNIKLGDRTHSHGVDMKTTPDGDKQSFGQILSKAWADQFTALIKKYENKYTDEQYYEWIKKYGPEISKKINIKYK